MSAREKYWSLEENNLDESSVMDTHRDNHENLRKRGRHKAKESHDARPRRKIEKTELRQKIFRKTKQQLKRTAAAKRKDQKGDKKTCFKAKNFLFSFCEV